MQEQWTDMHSKDGGGSENPPAARVQLSGTRRSSSLAPPVTSVMLGHSGMLRGQCSRGHRGRGEDPHEEQEARVRLRAPASPAGRPKAGAGPVPRAATRGAESPQVSGFSSEVSSWTKQVGRGHTKLALHLRHASRVQTKEFSVLLRV